ncbi:hypothetical protein PRZ48_005611 [Zasmidium cellare]|uniref:Uncharacterized protein n=1 Tax=Zasmidium cellare TaxID=395010 RepID=A0ABR0EKV5_ZASCE|nr:hypothetical protein PRZ48_005611 [Zasmidium cellare]
MERQPAYRRPSWARTEKSYKYYMRKDLAVDRSPCSDNGMEHFSYDPDYLTLWKMPESLRERLPQKLSDAVKDWEYAGAAVCTAIERIKKLDQQAIYRGYPDKSKHPLSRQTSHQSSAVVGADTPPMSSPDSPTPSMSSSILPLEKLSFEGLPQRRMIGMESPPFTPIDSKACPTPDIPTTQKDSTAGAVPDANILARQLSPLSIITTDSGISLPPPAQTPVFDENAWETYLSAFKAELADCKEHAWPRFRGYGYTVDRMRVELSQEAEYGDLMKEFQEWWGEMKLKVGEYEREVKELEVPRIEVVVLERKARGLSC